MSGDEAVDELQINLDNKIYLRKNTTTPKKFISSAVCLILSLCRNHEQKDK